MKELVAVVMPVLFILVFIAGCGSTPSTTRLVTVDASNVALDVTDFPMGWGMTREAVEGGYYSRFFSETKMWFGKSVVCRIKVLPSINDAKNEYNAQMSATKYSYSKESIGDEAFIYESGDWHCTRFRRDNVVAIVDTPKDFYNVNSLNQAIDWAKKLDDRIKHLEQQPSSPSTVTIPATTSVSLPRSTPTPVSVTSSAVVNNNCVNFQEDFSTFDNTKWMDATCLPLYSGRIQTINQTSIDGKNVIFIQTDESPSNKRRGIISTTSIPAPSPMTVEMAFKPIGDLDGVLELWLFDQGTSSYVRMCVYAGDYGATPTVYAEMSGQEQRGSPPKVFNWNEWLLFKIEATNSATILSLIDANQKTRWSTTYNLSLNNHLKNFNIAIAQVLGQPSSGTYHLKSYIDYIKVTG